MSFPLSEPSQFRQSEDSSAPRRAANPPKCILEHDSHIDKKRSDLSDEQVEAAKQELLRKDFINLEFPRTMKLGSDPPVNSQVYGLYSFIPAKGAKPDLQGSFGVIKLRGCYPTVEEAERWSEQIIRSVDTYAVIDMTWVGKPAPVMVNNEIYRGSTAEVDVRKVMDETQRAELKTKREADLREQESIQRRHKELLADVNEEKQPDDAETYTMMCVKRANALFAKENALKQLKEYDVLIEKMTKQLVEMDKQNPSLKEGVMKRYTDALASTGIRPENAPLIKYMKP